MTTTDRSETAVSVWARGEVTRDRVPERYRLGEQFVPKARYLDPEFQQLEVERLFGRTWLMACREEELPGVGSFVEYRISDRSILVVRESAESIRAYHNACRHRGTRLATGRGRVGSIICPFHGWRWNLDGSIRLVLDPEEFPDRSDDDLGLQPVRCETWGGFVFVNMDLAAEPLLAYLDPIPTVFAPFTWERMRYRWMKGITVPCNWKTVLDGFLEAYHVPGTHPQLARYDRSNHNIATPKELESRSWAPTAVFGKFARYSTVGRKQTARTTEQRAKKDPTARSTRGAPDLRHSFAANVEYIAHDMRALENERSLRAAELLRTTETPEGMNVGQHYLQLLREVSVADGLDWQDITPEQWAAAGTAWLVFPNTILLPNQGCVIGYRARPMSKDPDTCLFEAFSLEQVPVAEYEVKRDFAPQFFDDHRHADVGDILTQDLDNCENITVGMHSPSFDGHYLSGEQEMTIYNAHAAADRYLWTD
jgi:phenylpropionate dioxygenase-like ring-hydroxylating dioxygenase large terminal subunit